MIHIVIWIRETSKKYYTSDENGTHCGVYINAFIGAWFGFQFQNVSEPKHRHAIHYTAAVDALLLWFDNQVV